MGHFEHINDLSKVAGISSSILQKISSTVTCRKRHLRALGCRKSTVHHTDSRFASLLITVCFIYNLFLLSFAKELKERLGIDDIILVLQQTGYDGMPCMGMCCKRKTMIR